MGLAEGSALPTDLDPRTAVLVGKSGSVPPIGVEVGRMAKDAVEGMYWNAEAVVNSVVRLDG